MRVVFGIGNPGSTYAGTRHNVGWFVADSLVDDRYGAWMAGAGPFDEASITVEGERYLVVKPLTFVNRSGEAAATLCDRYDVSPSDLLVILDDVHLQLGDMRLRQGGSSGGHNGLRSIESDLGTQETPRLRIGIGAPSHFGALVSHVLSPFLPEEEPIIRETVRHAVDIAEAFGRCGYEAAAASFGAWKSDSAGNETGLVR